MVPDELRIPTEAMIAFGDDYADIGMLRLCGKGIAMGNAIDAVKDAANQKSKTSGETDESDTQSRTERYCKALGAFTAGKYGASQRQTGSF
ncbi:MAG: HAD hydrolase family protein [Lachnospiraceae bacterium]|nr:HAD hydrolase family protein [Lachnospiraceae bacterium]